MAATDLALSGGRSLVSESGSRYTACTSTIHSQGTLAIPVGIQKTRSSLPYQRPDRPAAVSTAGPAPSSASVHPARPSLTESPSVDADISPE